MAIDRKLGLTPIYSRLAVTYLKKGVGTYDCDVFGYDTVKVSVQRPWEDYSTKKENSAFFIEFRVTFYTKGERKKWFEFKSLVIGGGSSKPEFQEV